VVAVSLCKYLKNFVLLYIIQIKYIKLISMQLSFPHNQSTTTSPNFNTNYHNSYQYQPSQTYQLQPTVVN
jgi:hypothetical protein